MQSVQIIYTRNWLPGSLLIRLLTWSRWSHVALVVNDQVIEAAIGVGVRRRPLEELVAASSAWSIQALPVRDASALIAAVESQIGMPYDYLGALGIALRGNWQECRAWFCSELIAWAADHAGSPWFRRERIRRVTPEHLWMLAPADVNL